jgi:hypothetical protein
VTQEWDQDILLRSQDQKIEKQWKTDNGIWIYGNILAYIYIYI